MASILAAFGISDPASLKRLLSSAIGGLILLVANPALAHFGMPSVPPGVVEMLVGLLATFVLQSGIKSAVVAHAAGKVEAAKVTTAAQALAALTAPEKS